MSTTNAAVEGQSKRDAIIQMVTMNPDLRGKSLEAQLKKAGVSASPTYVSKIRTETLGDGSDGRRVEQGKRTKPQSNGRPTKTVPPGVFGSLAETVREAELLSTSYGGIKAVVSILDAVDWAGGTSQLRKILDVLTTE